MGTAKSDLVLGGRRLIEIAADTLRSVFDSRVAAVGVRSAQPYPCRLIADARPDGLGDDVAGPLVGLYTALADSQDEWIAVLACDLPFVTAALFELLTSIDSAFYDAVVPVQPDGWPQPLCALYRRETCLVAAESLLKQGAASVQALVKAVNTRLVPFDEFKSLPDSGRFFLNLNTPEEFRKAEAALRTTRTTTETS